MLARLRSLTLLSPDSSRLATELRSLTLPLAINESRGSAALAAGSDLDLSGGRERHCGRSRRQPRDRREAWT